MREMVFSVVWYVCLCKHMHADIFTHTSTYTLHFTEIVKGREGLQKDSNE